MMTDSAIYILAVFAALALFVVSGAASYWQERSEGKSHIASMRGVKVLMGLLSTSAIVDYVAIALDYTS